MNWNILLKRTNRELKKKEIEIFDKQKEKIENYKKRLNDSIKTIRKNQPIYYRIKDRFFKIYKIFIPVLIIWFLPVILFISRINKSPLYFILLVVYMILTTPLFLLSLSVPTIKFFFYDLPNIRDDIKVYASARYVIAIFFEENRIVVPVLKKIDENNMINHKKLPYIVDRSASFLSLGKVMISFYVVNIPNPLKFNFRKYIEMYAEIKLSNPMAEVKDFDNELIDTSFSSGVLKDYKKHRFLKEFFRDYSGENNKLLMAVIGLCGLFCIAVVVMYILKGG